MNIFLPPPFLASLRLGLLAITFMLVCVGGSSISIAQQQNQRPADFRVVATVGTSAITNFDVVEFARLLAVFSGAPKPPTANVALRQLVRSYVMLQEAQRTNIEVIDGEVDNAFSNIARSAKTTPERLRQKLTENGVSAETISFYLRSSLSWDKMLNQRFAATALPTQEEVSKAIASLGAQDKRYAYSYQLAQLIMPMAADADSDMVARSFAEAKGLRDSLHSCEDIETKKGDFAEGSGKMPASTIYQLPRLLADRVLALKDGEMADVFRSPQGLHILMVCERSNGPTAEMEQQLRRQLQLRNIKLSSDDLLRRVMRKANIQIKQ